MRKYARPVVLHVLLPLIVGTIIYLLFRQHTFLHRIFFSGTDYKAIIISENKFANVIAFNLPDFCWSYSFASALFIWEKRQERIIKYFPFIVLLILLMGELIQLFLPSMFTFDWLDLIAAFSAFLLSYRKFRMHEKA